MTLCVPDPSILRLSPAAVVEAIYEAINRRDYEQGFRAARR